jgi:hypothetical protein
MGEGKMLIMKILIAFLGIALGGGASSDQRQQGFWKLRSTGASSSKGKPISSSIVLPLYGNVYPEG